MSGTLTGLGSVPVTSERDRLAAAHLRERLEAQLALYRSGEQLRDLRTPFGLVSNVRDSVDLLPRRSDEDWRNIAARLRAIPEMFAGWRTSLDEGLARGLPAARRQAVEGAIQADKYAAGTHGALVAGYGDGPLAAELAAAACAAHAGYAETARYLRESYAPRATETDAVGAERYALAARLTLGADLDPREAYEWGWAELARIEAEMAAEAGRVRHGASVDEATAILDGSAYVDGDDAYLDWLKERHARAVEALDGVHFDIAPPLRAIDVVLARSSTSGAAYYTPPTEDLSRPGRTWWLVRDRDRFNTWDEPRCILMRGRTRSPPAGGCRGDSGRLAVRVCEVHLHQRARRGLGPLCRAAGRRARLVRSTGHAAGHARRFGAASRPRGHRHRRAPGPPAAGRLSGGPSRRRARCCASEAAPSRAGCTPRW